MKALKIITFIVLGLCIIALFVFFGGWLYYHKKFPVNEEAYPNYVGYINQETTALNRSYNLCDPKQYITYITVLQKKDMLVIKSSIGMIYWRNTKTIVIQILAI